MGVPTETGSACPDCQDLIQRVGCLEEDLSIQSSLVVVALTIVFAVGVAVGMGLLAFAWWVGD